MGPLSFFCKAVLGAENWGRIVCRNINEIRKSQVDFIHKCKIL